MTVVTEHTHQSINSLIPSVVQKMCIKHKNIMLRKLSICQRTGAINKYPFAYFRWGKWSENK